MAAIVLCASSVALAESSSASPPQAAQPTEWKQWKGHYYRLEADGHLSCYSENSSKSACSINAPDATKAQPLKCNDARWGGKVRRRTGYEVSGHWCNTAYANLFAEWKSYKPLGFDMQLATTPRGDVMCRSADGTTCSPSDAPVATAQIDPLVCGKIYKRRTGGPSTGYDDPEHWCRSREIVVHTDKTKMAEVEKDGFLAFEGTVPMKGWRQEEQPSWIIRFKGADKPFKFPTDLTLTLNGRWPKGRGWEGHNYIAVYLNPDDPGHAPVFTVQPHVGGLMGYSGRASPVQLDTERRGTIAFRIEPNGVKSFFQAAGWPTDIFDKRFALTLADGFAAETFSRPLPAEWAMNAETSDLVLSADFFYSNSSQLPEVPGAAVPTVTEVIMTRKRREPPQ